MDITSFAHWQDQPEEPAPFLSVVIATQNESHQIIKTILTVSRHLTRKGISAEIVIADDGSTNGTADRCRNLGLRNLIVVASQHPRGRAANLKRGALAARGSWLMVIDADLASPIAHIERLLLARWDADIVIATSASASRESLTVGRRIARTMFRKRANAPASAFTLMSPFVVDALFRSPGVPAMETIISVRTTAIALGLTVADVSTTTEPNDEPDFLIELRDRVSALNVPQPQTQGRSHVAVVA